MADMSSLTTSTQPSNHLVLPANRVSVHTVTLPPTPAHRMQAALAGVLEEQLLDDPADLHFALAPDAVTAMKAGRAFDVMVCDKAWLQAMLDKARGQGRVVDSIVPESAASQALGWNLAQFDFRPQSRFSTQVKSTARAMWSAPEWRWARIGLLLLVAVQIIGLNLWSWRDRAELAAKRAQMGQILLQSYPDTKIVVDAPAQMAKSLALDKAQRGGLGEQSLESQLASKAIPGKAYSQIDFANGELKLLELKVGAP
jgi:type II secretory pathway component PulL